MNCEMIIGVLSWGIEGDFLYTSYYYDYDVMLPLNIGLWLKEFLILEPWSYNHVIKEVGLLRTML